VHFDNTGAADAYVPALPLTTPLVANMYEMQNVSVSAKPGATVNSASENVAAMTAFEPLTLAQDTSLMNALGDLYSVASAATTFEIDGGIIPDLAMPSMTITAYSGAPNDSIFLPLITLSTNTDGLADCLSFADPFTAADQEGDELRPPGMLYRQYRTRTANAIPLASGYQMMTFHTHDPSCGRTTHPPAPFTVGIAENATFGMPLTADGTPVTVAPNGFADLTFALSDGGTGTSDCTVTLYTVTPTFAPLHTFTVLAKATNMKVSVPTSGFVTGQTYAFGITCRDGFPLAKNGDYTMFSGYPQQESQIFPGTFVVTLQ
jgi:hypothetical protein